MDSRKAASMRRGFVAFAIVSALAHATMASQIASRSLEEVAKDAAIVVVGTVEKVETHEESVTHGRRLIAQIRVVSYLRGQAKAETLRLALQVGGIRGFDVPLAQGDHAVFFLRSIEGGEARLHTWSSIAVFPSGHFHAE